MSIQISFYALEHQEKPAIEIREAFGSIWLEISYGDGQGSSINFHGRSRAQCERLAAAWLGMWDEPAELTGSPDLADAIAYTYAGLKEAGIVPLAGGGNISRINDLEGIAADLDQARTLEAKERRKARGLPDRIVRPDTIHPEDGQPLDDEEPF